MVLCTFYGVMHLLRTFISRGTVGGSDNVPNLSVTKGCLRGLSSRPVPFLFAVEGFVDSYRGGRYDQGQTRFTFPCLPGRQPQQVGETLPVGYVSGQWVGRLCVTSMKGRTPVKGDDEIRDD